MTLPFLSTFQNVILVFKNRSKAEIRGVHFPMRMDGKVENIPVLAAVAVTQTGVKLVLGLQMGDKELASCWREVI